MPPKPTTPGRGSPSVAPAVGAPPPPGKAATPKARPTGQSKAPAQVVEDHLPFVRSVARKLREHLPGVDLEDLVSFGVQGLLEAAQRYDERHGAVFITFAYYRVRGAMFDGLRSMGWLPRAEYARLRFEERANAYLENLAARDSAPATSEPTVEEDVAALSTALHGVAAVFVTLLGRSEEESLIDGKPMAHDELERHQLSHRVRRALARLPDKERYLIETYYFEDQTLEQVGARMGLSKSWTSRLHARAVTLLRASLAEEEDGDPPT